MVKRRRKTGAEKFSQKKVQNSKDDEIEEDVSFIFISLKTKTQIENYGLG